MSEAPHGAPIKTPKQLIAVVVAAFAIPVAVILLLAYNVDETVRTGAGTETLTDTAVAKRIAPLAQVTVSDANAPHVFKTGEEVFKAVCSSCHATGVAGAPKFENTADWAPRIAQGYDALLHAALNGKNAMPARGGASPDEYSDYELARAVVYMANHSGAHFPEPNAPAQGASAAAPAPSSQSADAGTQATSQQAAAAMAALNSASSTAEAPSTATATPSADAAQAGKALYQQVCQTCHAVGVLGAPKFGDKTAWAPRLKEPMGTIYNYVLRGKGNMPPKGGSTASDADVKAAVDYMVNAAK